MTTVKPSGEKPWYRYLGPWLLMVGPLVVIIAALFTAWLAVKSADGLVVEDYYKQGLRVDQTLALSEKARTLGLRVGIRLNPAGIALHLSSTEPNFVPPSAVIVTLSHPTRAGMDQVTRIVRQDDVYRGEFRLPQSGHWLVLVEDPANEWRLLGNVILPAAGETVIGGS